MKNDGCSTPHQSGRSRAVARRLSQLSSVLKTRPSHWQLPIPASALQLNATHSTAVDIVGGGAVPRASSESGAAAPNCLDYAYSFVTGGGPDNAIRFWVESKTTLFDDVNGTAQAFYQCASCKSEDTFGRGLERSGKLLFQDPNYDFCPVYSTPPVQINSSSSDPTDLTGGELIIYRRRLEDVTTYRQVLAYEEAIDLAFGVPTLRPYEARAVYEVDIDDFDSIAEATRNCVPMVQRTELLGNNGLRAVIECPIKTMNIAETSSTSDHHPARTWQTDTGPIALPDLTTRHTRHSDALSLGFIAINNIQSDTADLVVEQPTEVRGGDGHVTVMHYSNPFNLPATSKLLCIPPPL